MAATTPTLLMYSLLGGVSASSPEPFRPSWTPRVTARADVVVAVRLVVSTAMNSRRAARALGSMSRYSMSDVREVGVRAALGTGPDPAALGALGAERYHRSAPGPQACGRLRREGVESRARTRRR